MSLLLVILVRFCVVGVAVPEAEPDTGVELPPESVAGVSTASTAEAGSIGSSVTQLVQF